MTRQGQRPHTQRTGPRVYCSQMIHKAGRKSATGKYSAINKLFHDAYRKKFFAKNTQKNIIKKNCVGETQDLQTRTNTSVAITDLQYTRQASGFEVSRNYL